VLKIFGFEPEMCFPASLIVLMEVSTRCYSVSVKAPFLQSSFAEQSHKLRQPERCLTNGFRCWFITLISLQTTLQELS